MSSQAPAVFVINLDRAETRLAAVTRQLDQFGWSFERIRALDARAMDSTKLRDLAPDPWSAYQARMITPGEICCLASHRAAWTRLLACGATWALILEDDACLGADVPAAVHMIGQQNFFDCVKLEGIAEKAEKSRGVQIVKGPPAIYLMRTVSAGAAAYCLSAVGATKLLRITAPMNREADFFIRQYGSTDLVVGEIRPFVAWQDRSGSYIGADRSDRVRPTAWQKLVRRKTRFQQSIRRRYRFRLLAGARPAVFVSMAGSSPSTVGNDL